MNCSSEELDCYSTRDKNTPKNNEAGGTDNSFFIATKVERASVSVVANVEDDEGDEQSFVKILDFNADCRNSEVNTERQKTPMVVAENEANPPLDGRLKAQVSEATSSRINVKRSRNKPVKAKIPIADFPSSLSTQNKQSKQRGLKSKLVGGLEAQRSISAKPSSHFNAKLKSPRVITNDVHISDIPSSSTAEVKQNRCHTVLVKFDSECFDKATAAGKIASISECRLNDSVIESCTTDTDGCTAVICKCTSENQARTLVRAINTRKCNAKAFFDVPVSVIHSTCSTHSQERPSIVYETEASGSEPMPSTGNSSKSFRSDNTKFSVVYVSFQTVMSKEQAHKHISDVSGFQLHQSKIEMDVVIESPFAYGAFIQCKTKYDAQHLMKDFNSSGQTCSSVAYVLESPIGDITFDSVSSELDSLAEKQIETHNVKCKVAIEKLEEAKQCFEKANGKNKFMPFDMYDQKTATVKPLEDKTGELLLQTVEFKTQLDRMRAKVDEIRHGRNTKFELSKIKQELKREVDQFSAALPIYAYKSDIVSLVQSNQVSIILGETGSGKSTQIMQYLLSTRLSDDGMIVCTQPRKVAAISLACRISHELCCMVGGLVGYKVGMQFKQSDDTRLLYVTDHVLLNDCLKDPSLDRYSCVVIDEAHERSIFTDLLLSFVKRALRCRADLRVIIMSATINPDLFVSYFADCSIEYAKPPIMQISGRAYHVEVVYGVSAAEDYVTEAALKALELHRQEPNGDILVFLTSPIETEQACKKMLNFCIGNEEIMPLELHGRLQIEEQQKVFDSAPKGKRKIVFATNSAETSITIPGIKYVIDTGRVREINYDPKKNMSKLAVQWITRSSAEQRKGRAGRTDCGKCFRLYSEEQYMCMREDSVPEILRVHLGHALLKLMTLGINDATQFDFIQAPMLLPVPMPFLKN